MIFNTNIIENIVTNSTIPNAEEIINKLFPNVFVFIAHTIATILLLVSIIFLVWKPTKKYIERRTQEIQKNIKEAEESRENANKNLEESKQKILESKITASQIIENAELEAEEKRKKIEKAAMNKASHIEKESLTQLKKQEQELSERMNLEVSKLALETAEIFLSKKIDEQENKKIIDNIINDLTNSIDEKTQV